nr:MAG TPA: hypothetical protein [Bacteriophage sp.]
MSGNMLKFPYLSIIFCLVPVVWLSALRQAFLFCSLPFGLTKVYQTLSTNTIGIIHKIKH